MVFRVSSQEVANIIGIGGGHLERSGCRGVSTEVATLEAGQLFLGESSSAQQAFDRGASLLITDKTASLSEEAKRYALEVPSLSETFWTLFRWWREEQKAAFIALVGEEPVLSWFQEVLAHLLLQERKGFYRGRTLSQVREDDELRVAAETMNCEEECYWSMLLLDSGKRKLFEALVPDVVCVDRASEGITSSLQAEKFSNAYCLEPMGNSAEGYKGFAPPQNEQITSMHLGKVGYLSDDFSLSDWPIPMLRSARSIRLVRDVAKAIGIELAEEQVASLGRRFYPPPHLGFSIPLGESGSIWIERSSTPNVEEVGTLLQDTGAETIAFLVEDEEGARELGALSGKAPVFLWPVNSSPGEGSIGNVILVKTFQEAMQALLQTPPFFLIAFVNNADHAQELFLMRDELYSIANSATDTVEDS